MVGSIECLRCPLVGLDILYLASVHLVDLIQIFAYGLGSVFLWIVDVEVQFKFTIEVVA